ncbi:hypothetical protein [Kitasatospora azatica]|uniref:hypothetical protein n=1 Tax=Kitasatospora azatica TaxID=58347 RepID=UPI000560023E|nr:hypothetical protein [Kitasatospora azatica]
MGVVTRPVRLVFVPLLCLAALACSRGSAGSVGGSPGAASAVAPGAPDPVKSAAAPVAPLKIPDIVTILGSPFGDHDPDTVWPDVQELFKQACAAAYGTKTLCVQLKRSYSVAADEHHPKCGLAGTQPAVGRTAARGSTVLVLGYGPCPAQSGPNPADPNPGSPVPVSPSAVATRPVGSVPPSSPVHSTSPAHSASPTHSASPATP